ncbi:MAG: hypothetical protein K8I29_03205 [Alphaproteobacteria bacterium]|uniref:Uncharacterized protein n=1 Tax=Candidatus Nitrobium versatile TaxID=2884831 RepID=A0A953LVS9_9BACT|nr:hypothetical protein [Candidatus Nitrobium versatile]
MKGRQKPQPETPSGCPGPRPPVHPYIVLLVAILLPGVGHVLNGQTKRGLTMLFFMISLGWVTYHLTTEHHSFLGRHAGGLFVYAMSLLDAYKWARYRREYHRVNGRLPGETVRESGRP